MDYNEDMNIVLPKSDEALLAQCVVTAYRSSGKGGQHVNKTDSAVRVKHLPTGLVATSQKERSQYLNKLECLKKLRKRVEKLNYRPEKRIATKPTKASKAKVAESKKRRSTVKKLRQKRISADS